jgi:SAM-dependent methyltransferase
MNAKIHWESVYDSKAPEAVSWYAPHLRESLRYVDRAAAHKGVAVIDVGGGESTLVDDLLASGYGDVTVLDISAIALEVTRRRLGQLARRVRWLVADVLEAELAPAAYDIWHDRAVFHFLTSDAQRRRYVAQVSKTLRPGGHAIVATFGPEGPGMCSGLPVSRYSPEELHSTFGEHFQLLDHSVELHSTPSGSRQQFVYCLFRRSSE